MNMKKKLTTIISGVLCLALLMALPFGFGGLADPDTGLNGDSGEWYEFDQSIYDVTVSSSSFKSKNFEWPSSGSVLVRASGTNWSASDFSGITVPAGIVLDIYQYAGGSTDSYKLLVHVDTTDGTPETIGSSSSNTGTSSNSGTVNRPSQAPNNSGNSGNSSTSSKDWGKVEKVFVPGTPSASYDTYYTDVPSTFWAYHPIMTMTEGGLLAGYGNHLFGPNDTLTKEQLDIIRTRIHEADYPVSASGNKAFASRAYAVILLSEDMDTGGGYLLTTYESSIIRDSGISGGLVFSLAQNDEAAIGSMSRCVYDNWRASLAAGRSTDYIASVDELPDADKIHQWIEENWKEMSDLLHINNPAKYASVHDRTVATCEQAICRAYNLGMVSGYDSAGSFSPYNNLTRAQLSQMLYNMGWIEAGCLDY